VKKRSTGDEGIATQNEICQLESMNKKKSCMEVITLIHVCKIQRN